MSYDYVEKCFSILQYIPSHVREYFCNHVGCTLQPKSLECYGIAMMVDVSGYSNLASNLAQRGSIGPELLSNSMNGYLDKMIKIILSYKGDLVKFAGDAIVICWTIDDINKYQYIMQEEYEEIKLALLLNTVRCSLQLLAELSKYTVEIDNLKIDLSIHIGLGLGSIFNVHVGGYPGRWEHFISGGAVNQVASILDFAKAGQLAMSVQFYKQFVKLFTNPNIDISNHQKGAIIMEATIKNVKLIFFQKSIFSKLPNIENLIELKQVEPPQLDKERNFFNNLSQSYYLYNIWKEYINEGALSKIESGTKNLIKFSELRRITTVFVKISNIRFENSNDLSLAQESLDAVQRALVLQEGILRQFLIDDKGAIILIYFGLPPLSHENDAQVGIEAALEICKNMKRVNDNFTIGVGTGMTWVGGIGNEDRADYSVVGDSVNMAARLMMKAEKNTILCDEETYKLTKEIISYKSIGTLQVKGKSKSIAAYQPVNSSVMPIHLPKITTEIELIGREKEIEKIENLLVSYSTLCEGRTLLVQGVEGLGLMPLAELLIKEAKKNKINVW
ncbi:adenylyl cyclase [Piromyces finnis]|uniref:Adenylyl cyclase n=1 Tax=Piromyces finnis TaxID=1754191 RepID=A0A1Y1VIL1_9FUNG|nr:adenylyl cyclase [Piromyces finnis]|eukprot:ORX57168.1 adenylyl cyclase [Piromyces finnis]